MDFFGNCLFKPLSCIVQHGDVRQISCSSRERIVCGSKKLTSYIYIFTSTTIYGVEVIPNSKYDQKCEYLFLARDEYYNVQCIVGKIKEGPDSDMRPSVDRMHSEKNVRRPLYMRRAVFVLDATI